MPADTALKICSRASLLMGGDPITSFTQGTAEADVADAIYEDTARAALTDTRWRFASKQVALTLESTAPVSRWDAAYTMPHDLIMLSAVTINDNPIQYDTYGRKIYCNATANDTVVADYIHRVDESDWPPFFTAALEFDVASILAVSVARDASLARMLQEKAQFAYMKARRLDSQQQTTRKLNTSRFIAERRS